jgi:hypothetical protein
MAPSQFFATTSSLNTTAGSVNQSKSPDLACRHHDASPVLTCLQRGAGHFDEFTSRIKT